MAHYITYVKTYSGYGTNKTGTGTVDSGNNGLRSFKTAHSSKVHLDPISESTLLAELDNEGEVTNMYPFSPSTVVGQVSQGEHKSPNSVNGIEVVNTVELGVMTKSNDAGRGLQLRDNES